ncbi:MAG: transcription-repair coupling factor (superfamily II helicase) [Chlamydiales bacterium]|jgi:transcription-repair coupling factor (superfamily II helicase)
MTVEEENPALAFDLARLAPFLQGEEVEHVLRGLVGLPPDGRLSVGNLWGSSQALVIAGWLASAASDEQVWIIASSETEAESFTADLQAFGVDATLFPAREGTLRTSAASDTASIRTRLQAAQALAGPRNQRPRVLVASILAHLQPIPSVRDLHKDFLRLQVGHTLDIEKLLKRLVKGGYVREPLAEAPGEISLRGDILDLFPFASDLPLRIELFEDEIESLRTFEPSGQRSLESMKQIEICLAGDAGPIEDGGGVQAIDFAGPDCLIVEVEPLRVDERAEALRIQSPDHERSLRSFKKALLGRRRLALQVLPGDDISLDTRSVQALSVGTPRAGAALRDATKNGDHAIVLCGSDAERERFIGAIADQGGAGDLDVRVGSVARGFRCPNANLLIVNHREILGIGGVRRGASAHKSYNVRALQSFFELKPGDLVVHAVHGLARFNGLKKMQRGGGEEDHLQLMFADEVLLFVPASRIDMVQRYIGTGGGSTAPLDKIGGTTFRKRKEKVERGLFDLAADLIEVQANRALKERPSWRADDDLVRLVTESFEYEDTPDQVESDQEIQADLYSKRPMDRLLCGDVGFGKTELAVRAAFRVVNGGGQVAVLVPTTVLAAQHYKVFSERLADFPVEVAMVSRYVSTTESKKVAERAQKGAVDILIGTHRILSKDVKFKQLGLVIIDEEQRFGVQHKEHFKKLRATVDLLTMSATPIPRTLHMSLSGIRDISALSAPPPGRQDIETVLGYSTDDETIRRALVREKNRGGQVFFLHNRIASIEATAARLQRLVPECSYAIGHGQMSARELQRVMDDFFKGSVDVLVATTIIENGLDVPSAGTIIIDDADHFGLSEMHQLRGRVGRGSHKAYCYLLVEQHKPLKDIARERLKALEEMSHLGAGFGISIKDLELRGAGNVLGAAQSGHIAAVGYDMYCRLLKNTIERLQAGEGFDRNAARDEETEAGVELELGLRALLPVDYVPAVETRLEVLRELAQIHTQEDCERARAMLRDRFGRIPPETESLLRVFTMKARLDPFLIRRFAWQDDVYLIQYDDPVAFEQLFGRLGVKLRRIRSGVAHMVIDPRHRTAEAALEWFEGLLNAAAARGMIELSN